MSLPPENVPASVPSGGRWAPSIAGQIALVVLLCAGGGLALVSWVGTAMFVRVDLRADHECALLVSKDGQRLREASDRFLSTAAAVIDGGGARGVVECLKQKRRTIAVLGELERAVPSPPNDVRRAVRDIEMLALRCCSRAELSAAGAPVDGALHAGEAKRLTRTIDALGEWLQRRARASARQLAEKDAEIGVMWWSAIGGYTLLVALVWWFASRSIARPLRRVRDAADAGEIEARSAGVGGPREVRQLWRAVMRFEDQQQRIQRELERANRVKDEFVANMSHELRTPLNGVIGYLDLLALDEPTGERREMLEAATSSAQHLMAVIGDILDCSKFQSQDVELDRAVCDLATIGREVGQILELPATNRGNALRVELDDRLPARVLGDPLRLRQVLLNLCGNAIKFTRDGTVTLSVQLLEAKQHACRVRFSVRDTGIGIAPELVARLFRPFVQADASTTREHGGTGLGLAICKLLVERMGGRIDVASVVGEGTELAFAVDFEQVADDLPAVALATPGTPGSAVAAGRGAAGGARVLLVEDNAVNQRVTRAMLERSGYVVDIAGNGSEALAASDEVAYDLILMDTQMPVLDGPEATRRIRARERERPERRRVPILALTANSGADDRRTSLEAGADGYLTKPFRMAQLIAAAAEAGGGPAAGERA